MRFVLSLVIPPNAASPLISVRISLLPSLEAAFSKKYAHFPTPTRVCVNGFPHVTSPNPHPYRNPIFAHARKNTIILVTSYKLYALSLSPDGNDNAKDARLILIISQTGKYYSKRITFGPPETYYMISATFSETSPKLTCASQLPFLLPRAATTYPHITHRVSSPSAAFCAAIWGAPHLR